MAIRLDALTPDASERLAKDTGRTRKTRPGPARNKHCLRCARIVLTGKLTSAEAGRAFQVARGTVDRWIAELRDEDGPDGDELRGLVGDFGYRAVEEVARAKTR